MKKTKSKRKLTGEVIFVEDVHYTEENTLL